MKRTAFLVPIFLLLFFSCIRKKDFDFNKVKWDNITPSWGLPLVNSTLTIADALDKNTSNLIIQRDPDGFITFIYLDTVESPTGEKLFKTFNFNPEFRFMERASIGAIPSIPLAIAPPSTNVDAISGTMPFEIENVESITKIVVKSGRLDVQTDSKIKHTIAFTLRLPDLVSSSGTPFEYRDTLEYPADIKRNKPSVDLAGYTLSAANGKKNEVAFELRNIVVVYKSDNNITTNPVLPSDSLRFSVNLTQLNYKRIQGVFNPLTITPDQVSNLIGSTNINAFDKASSADVRLENPSVVFNFNNSFGITPTVNIEEAKMLYSYGKPDESFLTNGGANMNIPGSTSLNAVSIPDAGKSVDNVVILDKSTSNITQVLQGAPYKFNYKIPSIVLSTPGSEAFLADDSQLKIYTEVKLPLFGAVRNLVISDSIRKIELPKAENVEYVEFRIGSENSIPTNIRMQAYFIDTNQRIVQGGVASYPILDSLIVPPTSDMIIEAGDMLKVDNAGNIIQTKVKSYYSTVPVTKERYKRVASTNMIVVKGTLITKDSEKNKTVKFFTWQTCTFKLSAYAKLRIDPSNPEEITNIGK